MDLSAILAHPFALLATAGLGIFVLRCLTCKPQRPARKKRLRIAGAFLGNALMPLHNILQPQARHVVTEQMEDREDDPSADPDNPAHHLQRQLNRIRNGEQLDHITTRLR